MPQTLDNGTVAPINSDAYALAADLATMGNSVAAVTPVVSQTARDALTKFNGRSVTRLDVAGCPLEVWDGTKWNRTAGPYAIATGTFNVLMNAGTVYTNITFPTGRFSVTPMLVANMSNAAYAMYTVAEPQSATGGRILTVWPVPGSNVTVPVQWVAVQMTATTAAG